MSVTLLLFTRARIRTLSGSHICIASVALFLKLTLHDGNALRDNFCDNLWWSEPSRFRVSSGGGCGIIALGLRQGQGRNRDCRGCFELRISALQLHGPANDLHAQSTAEIIIILALLDIGKRKRSGSTRYGKAFVCFSDMA